MAQGVANIVSPLFGGLARHGRDCPHRHKCARRREDSRRRNDPFTHPSRNRAVCRAAGEECAALAALAAILMIVAYNMGDWQEIPEILKLSAADIAVWLLTFTLTVVADLTFAVEVGMVLAALTFIRKVSRTTTVTSRHERLRRRQPRARSSRQRHSALRDGVPHPWPVSFRSNRQIRGNSAAILGFAPADRHPAPAQHDGNRRHRPRRHSRLGRYVYTPAAARFCSAEPANNPRN